ncbi:cytochrome C oxidase subunit II [Evansella sp. AB-rgal1]|uniref:cytochrome C oxidase subunit II n=1 Tax=Evansella sp. AB-rgal1 TaxID=3242696 RepID=UPI00359EF718
MRIRMIFILLSTILFLTGCGGGNEGSTNSDSTDTNTVTIVASDWKFDKDEYKVPAGKVTIKLSNEQGYHGIKIDGTDVDISGDGSFTTTLEPGEYRIWCSIMCGTGHDDMISYLIVE